MPPSTKEPFGKANGWIRNKTKAGRQKSFRTHRRSLSLVASGSRRGPLSLLSGKSPVRSGPALFLVGHESQRLCRAASHGRCLRAVAALPLDEMLASRVRTTSVSPTVRRARTALELAPSGAHRSHANDSAAIRVVSDCGGIGHPAAIRLDLCLLSKRDGTGRRRGDGGEIRVPKS